MGAKIESLNLLEYLGLPAPRHVFIFNEDEFESRFADFAGSIRSEKFGVRTDTESSSLSLPRKFAATKEEVFSLGKKWLGEGYQLIIQENIEPEFEEKSGNVYVGKGKIVIESANDAHHVAVNSQKVDEYIEAPRFWPFGARKIVRSGEGKRCLSGGEFTRLVRLAGKIPFDDVILEFSFTKDGRLFFWEIKKLK